MGLQTFVGAALVSTFAQAGCGRLEFDVTPDAGTVATHLTCNSDTVIAPLTNGDGVDSIAWIVDPTGDWILATQHRALTDHPLRRYQVRLVGDRLEGVDQGVALETRDPRLPGPRPEPGQSTRESRS